jgi:uncharacterized membrane protein YqhA
LSDQPTLASAKNAVPRLLAAYRFCLLVAVAGCLAIATVVVLFAFGLVVSTSAGLLSPDSQLTIKAGKGLALAAISIVDLFLVAAVAYIAAVGIYTLFISPHVPQTLRMGIESLDDLKQKLVGVLVVALGVLFLGEAVNWSGEKELLYLGLPIAAVIAALGYFVHQRGSHGPSA